MTAERNASLLIAVAVLGLGACASTAPEVSTTDRETLYADYVWPPPPAEPRIQLVDIITSRSDVEAVSKLQKRLLGATPQSPYDHLRKPFSAVIDSQDRILVSDIGLAAIIRFDRKGRRMDVLGTTGPVRVSTPYGLDIGPDDTLYVADAKAGKIIGLSAEGKVTGVWGSPEELVNPTGVVLSPDGARLYVADSKGNKVAIYDMADGKLISTFGERGSGEGQFYAPTSLAFGPEGNLYVVDQLNTRVVVCDGDGGVVDQFGTRGVGFGQFVRPKDVAVDERGFIYVTDASLNNMQLFDYDFTLLTFVGQFGKEPGSFSQPVGIGVRGDQFVIVDQINRRIQLFRFLDLP
jgi:DNA-binding beta-propeller fold protein YncE